MLLAGDPEVDVRVDEGRQRQQALAVDGLRPLRGVGRTGGCELSDLAASHEQVACLVDAGARVEDARTADQELGLLAAA